MRRLTLMTRRPRVLSQALVPERSLLTEVTLLLAASLFIAATAQFRIELGISPVPITGQTFGVLLIGALLGSRRAPMAVLLYLAEGAAGLPVFTGGAAGAAHLVGPTGGYLLGFVAAAGLVGWLAERDWDRRPTTAVLAMALGNVVIYAFGLAVLSAYVPSDVLLLKGMILYLPGDLVKIALAAALLPLSWRLVE